jgi:hypothetical protein
VATAPTDTTTPIINSTTSHSVNEGQVYTATATANETVTWTKSGTDASLVTLNSTSGVWSVPAQDFETRPSVSFNLIATDAAGNPTTQAVTLTITDVAEGGADTTAPTLTFPTGTQTGRRYGRNSSGHRLCRG